MLACVNHPFFKVARVAQFVLALSIFTYMALAPGGQIKTLGVSDLVLHAIGNVLLYLSASLACYGRYRIGLLLLFLLPYSLAVELTQHLSPGRQVDSGDMLANVGGLMIGMVLSYTFEWLYRKCRI